MRPTVVISDVHGTIHWREFVGQRQPGDRAVFLVDYFDRRGFGPFARDDASNFLDICAYAESHPYTVLLIGNHDYSTFPSLDGRPSPGTRQPRRPGTR